MTTDGLLAEIIEHPDDDGLRLIYADRCGERGEVEQAMYIRARVEWDRLPVCGHDWVLRPGGLKCPTCRRKDELYARDCNDDGFPLWENWLSQLERSFRPMEVVMKRGFVDAVTCRLSDWIGGPCQRCGGNGMGRRTGNMWSKCKPCNRTGRVNARGPALVRLTPVRTVRTDKEPHNGSYCPWAWWNAGRGLPGGTIYHRLSELPEGIFRLLPPGPDKADKTDRYSCYATEADATAALSLALLRWARGGVK